jgi:hypothetical protein
MQRPWEELEDFKTVMTSMMTNLMNPSNESKHAPMNSKQIFFVRHRFVAGIYLSIIHLDWERPGLLTPSPSVG